MFKKSKKQVENILGRLLALALVYTKVHNGRYVSVYKKVKAGWKHTWQTVGPGAGVHVHGVEVTHLGWTHALHTTRPAFVNALYLSGKLLEMQKVYFAFNFNDINSFFALTGF